MLSAGLLSLVVILFARPMTASHSIRGTGADPGFEEGTGVTFNFRAINFADTTDHIADNGQQLSY